MKRWNQLSATALLLAVTTIGAGCAGGDFTTREKGAGIGALGGAAAGGAHRRGGGSSWRRGCDWRRARIGRRRVGRRSVAGTGK